MPEWAGVYFRKFCTGLIPYEFLQHLYIADKLLFVTLFCDHTSVLLKLHHSVTDRQTDRQTDMVISINVLSRAEAW